MTRERLKQMSAISMWVMLAQRGNLDLLSTRWVMDNGKLAWMCRCQNEAGHPAFHLALGVCAGCDERGSRHYQSLLEAYRFVEKQAVADFVVVSEKRLHGSLLVPERNIH